tara:strand:- start:154 stop:348 length:195 start_codon:yes stop_codon:yes gene_type:complete
MTERDAEGFSELQLKRRAKTLEVFVEEAKAFVEPSLKLANLLVRVYNAGYADSQNETRDSFKLE